MDGVLIDSGHIYGRHWAVWAAAHGIDLQRVERVHPGRPPEDTIRLVAPGLDARAEADRFNAALAADRAIDEVTVLPGAVALLTGLPAGRWTIATSAQRAIAEVWLQRVGLPLPERFVSVEDVQRGKPAPDPYVQAARLLGADPHDCLVIEDAPAGISAGKAAGAHVLALRTTHRDDDLGDADDIADDLGNVSVQVRDGGLLVRW